VPFADDPEQALSLAWYAQRKPVYTGGNQVQLLRGGQALFPALIKAFEGAKQSIWLANYMVQPEGMPARVLQVLAEAAQRGVSVHMVIDGVGSHETPPKVWEQLANAGVALQIYRPVRHWWHLLTSTRDWRRMHIKLCVVDQDLAFVGGINLIDDLLDQAHGWQAKPRLDYAVQFTGPATLPALHTIRALWTRASLGRDWRDDMVEWIKVPGRLARLRGVWQQARLKLSPTEQEQLAFHAQARVPMRAAFVMRDNLRQRRTIEATTLQAIRQARYRIDLVCPYFYPGRVFRRALCRAAASGVKVRLLLQGKPDYAMAALAARVLYAELQRHGVRIFEYQPAFLHAKVMCVDEEWCSVGSSNLDPFSLQMNLEANLLVKDRPFAQTLAKALQQDFADSVEIVGDRDRLAPWWARPARALISWTARTYLRLGGARRSHKRARA
jgi:cardiolipin synthase